MRKLTWIWRLPSGVDVKATLDRRCEYGSVESVWLGRRLVSRALTGQRPHGHVVPLARGIGDAGPYRETADDLRVVFDEASETCTLWLGNEELAPWRSPRSAAARRGTQLAALSLGVGALLLFAVAWAFPRAPRPAIVRWMEESEWVSSREKIDQARGTSADEEPGDDDSSVVTLSPIVIYGEPPSRARGERPAAAREAVDLECDEDGDCRSARPAAPGSCVVEEEPCLPNGASWSSSSRSSVGGASPSSE